MKKKIGYALLAALIIIQFIRPERNQSNDNTNDISTKFVVNDEVKQLLKVACNDCHSNNTVYPWYANVQPVAWWLAHHVDEGKRELNFSNFAKYSPRRQYHKMEEVIEMIEHKEMPLPSYTWIHADAKLTEAQQKTLINWANATMDTLKAHYPMDSLVIKKR